MSSLDQVIFICLSPFIKFISSIILVGTLPMIIGLGKYGLFAPITCRRPINLRRIESCVTAAMRNTYTS